MASDPAAGASDHRPLRAGLIGCGFFAANHLYAWRDLAAEGVELLAVADSAPAKARAAAERFGVPRHYIDARRMLEREALDFVDIVTTMASHRPLVELAAGHGVAAIVQKPMAPSLPEAEAMVAACRRAGVPLMVHENFRFETPIRAVRQVLHQGRIGRPFFARISWRTRYDVFAGQPYLREVSRLIILDLVIHLLDVARFLFGEVRALACRTARVRDGIQGEDAAVLLLEHTDGPAVVVDATYSAAPDPDPFPETCIEIDGGRGTLRLKPGYDLQIDAADGSERRSVAPAAPGWATPPWQAVQESVVATQRHWLQCLRAGVEPATSGADNLKTLALVEAAYDSAATGRTIWPPVPGGSGSDGRTP